MAYPTAPPPTWAPYQYRRDPTDVMGRRIGAYLLGLLFTSIIVSGITAAIVFGAERPWTHHTTFGDARSVCSVFNGENHGDQTCVSVGDNEYYIVRTGPIVATFFAVYAGWFIIDAVIIEGLAGGKIGKLLLGLRVVRPDGQLAGVPRALLRNLLLIIPDQIILGLPGLVTALVSKGHRRVGDMAAGTYVVEREAVGHEVVIDGTSSGQYTAPGSGPGPGTGPYGAQQTQPGGAAWGTPQWPQQPSTQSAPQTPEPAAPRREPVWDEARNTHLWWDDDRHEWLEHDPESGQWRPLSR